MIKLSLSVRIAEGFQSKEQALLSLEQVADVAHQAGYDAICMRASQVGVQSPAADVERAVRLLAERQLDVSMVTGNFDIVYNNDHGPDCLRNIAVFLQLAKTLGAPLVRVALKEQKDIPWAQRASDEAAEYGVRLVHQCHTQSLFETVDGIEQTLRAIDRPNFGLVFEPANLELCGQDYGPATIQRLAPWIWNVYLQNQILKADGEVTLSTWCRGPVRFDLVPIDQDGGIDFGRVLEGLDQSGYAGPITVHQSAAQGQAPGASASAAARFLKERLGRLRA